MKSAAVTASLLLLAAVATGCAERPPDLKTRLAAGGLSAVGSFRSTSGPAFIDVSFSLQDEVNDEATIDADCLSMSFPTVTVTVNGADAPWGSVETDEGGSNGGGGGLTLLPGGGSPCSSPTIAVDVTEFALADPSERHVVVFSDDGSAVLTVEASDDEGAISCTGVLPCETR